MRTSPAAAHDDVQTLMRLVEEQHRHDCCKLARSAGRLAQQLALGIHRGPMQVAAEIALLSLGELRHDGADAAEAHAGAALRDCRVERRLGHRAQPSRVWAGIAAQEHAGRLPVVTLRAALVVF